MDRHVFLATSLLLLPVAIRAQWVQGGSFSSTNHFQACAFHDVDTGLFVYGTDNPASGEGGIIRTTSGMVSSGAYIWYRSPMNLEDIDVRLGSNGRPIYLAAGHQQYAYSVAVHPYLAGGNPYQFDSVRTGSSRYYRAIRMRSDIVAFAAGGDYLGNGIIDMSTDTGYHWTNVAMLPGQAVSRLHFVNDLLGFASTGGYRRLLGNGVDLPDSGAIYRTIDGGLNWLQVHADTVTGFSDVAFSSTLNGVATRNDGVILRTIDGGDTWSPATVNLAGPYVMTSVTFRNDGLGFAGCYRADGTSGFILISYDDGASWYENFNTGGLNHSRRIYDLYFFDDAHGYACTHIRPLRTTGIVTGVMTSSVPDLAIFPNPATDRVMIQRSESGPATVEVLDPAGRIVLSRSTNDARIDLPLGGLPAGHYLVRVRTDHATSTARLARVE